MMWTLLILIFVKIALVISSLSVSLFNSSAVNSDFHYILPSYIPSRVSSLVPIANRYGLSNTCTRNECGDFHLVVYYHSSSECIVLLRRLDDISWNFNVSIYIENQISPYYNIRENLQLIKSEDLQHEVFNLGKSSHFQQQYLINTTIILQPDNRIYNTQIIPKRIIQTYSSRYPSSIYQWLARKTFEDLNPEYELFMFNDKDCRQFLKEYFSSKVIDAYDILISSTFKSDLFRYAYLVVYGGCYFDHKMILRKPLRDIIHSNDTFLVCSDALPGGKAAETIQKTERFYNAMICTQPQDFRIWKTLNNVLSNIERRYSSGSDLALTGPTAFYKAIVSNITEMNLRWKHGFREKPLPFNKKRTYEDYYVIEKLLNSVFITKSYHGFQYSSLEPGYRYGLLWNRNLIYYDLLLKHSPWKIFVFPRQTRCIQARLQLTDDSYNLYLEPLTLLTEYELLDQKGEGKEAGAGLCRLIKLFVLNDETSESYKLDIPSSDLVNNKKYRVPISFDS
jgi:mannosyltransferase OCH1-like enzyme